MSKLLNSVLLIVCALMIGCVKKDAKQLKIEELEQKIHKVEAEMNSIEEKISAEKNNPGLQYSLGQQKELAKSRLERLKYNLLMLEGKKSKSHE